jgi:hypothetical protein
MVMNNKYTRFFCLLVLPALFACHKDFLDEKPEKSLVVPKTISDMEALLNNSNSVMNHSPWLPSFAGDEAYIPDQILISLDVLAQNSYQWKEDVYQGRPIMDWNTLYQQVFYANVVLDALKSNVAQENERAKVDELKGRALFYRGLAFFNLATEFAGLDMDNPEQNLLGLPIPRTANISEILQRSTVAELHMQIIDDLNAALDVLPTAVLYKTQSTKQACLALLARAHLYFSSFDEAEQMAMACLAMDDRLLDYNELSLDNRNPFDPSLPYGNPEVLFHSKMISNPLASASRNVSVDSLLLASYQVDDLRGKAFFGATSSGSRYFNGGYTGTTHIFTGLALDEVYLIAAECKARRADVDGAKNLLNILLAKRYRKDSFMPLGSMDSLELLRLILEERRKELVFRGVRWGDLRRLNMENQFVTTVYRVVRGDELQLLPNNPKYLFPVPDQEIQVNKLIQNPR